MNNASTYSIAIAVDTRYLSEQSDPDAGRYAFAYTIRIRNNGDIAAQLLDLYWKIIDGNAKVQEV